jgi:hypothetical protein
LAGTRIARQPARGGNSSAAGAACQTSLSDCLRVVIVLDVVTIVFKPSCGDDVFVGCAWIVKQVTEVFLRVVAFVV